MKEKLARGRAEKGQGEPRATGNSAFTLIELLVVIAVIAILAALLLPVLSRSKVAAENTVCRNNLRQQAIGLSMYVGEFRAYPQGAEVPLPGRTNLLWQQKLQYYVGDRWSPDTVAPISGRPTGARPRGLYSCPGYNRVGGVYWTTRETAMGAYGYSARTERLPFFGGDVTILTPGYDGSDRFRPVYENEVIAPTQLIAIGDSQMLHNLGLPNNITGGHLAPYTQEFLLRGLSVTPDHKALLEAQLRRHEGRWNMAFCDGHVEHGETPAFFDWRKDEALKHWSRDNKAHR